MADQELTARARPAAPSHSGLRARLLLCFLLPAAVAWLISVIWVPLELHQAEEYLAVAQSPSGAYSLFRPPGYIFFLHALVVSASPSGYVALLIYPAQAMLLGLAAAVFFLVARRWLQDPAACALALAFGCHPLALVLVGYIHYDLLHLTFLVFTTWCLVNGFGGNRVSWHWVVLAGVATGLTTLTRPMTLALPGVLALALVWLHGSDWKRWAGAWLVFTAVLLLTVAPRTWSNYRQTGRFLPVNAQTGAAFWPMTLTALHPTSDNFPWVTLWQSDGVPLVRERFGSAAGNAGVFAKAPLATDDLFKAEARKNFRAQPVVYFENVARNLVFFWTGDSRRIIGAFLFYQVAERPSRTAAWTVDYYVFATAMLHGLAAWGLLLACWRRERTLVLAGAVFVTLWFVHALVYLDARYLYAGLPFLLWFAGYGLRELLPQNSRRDLAAALAIAALSILGTGLLLI